MLSRVLASDDPRPVHPLPMRRILSAPKIQEASGDVEQRIAAIVAQVDQQWESRVHDARSAGLREGEAAGRLQTLSEVQPVVDRLARTIEELAGLKSRLRREAEADIVKLSLAIARRVLRREVAVDPEALHGIIVAALDKLAGQEACRVRVHPADAAAVTAGLAKTPGGSAITVTPDGSREPGTVIFETERGNLDCSLEHQLQEIERGLTDRLRSQA